MLQTIAVQNHSPYNTNHHDGQGGFINPLGVMRQLPRLRYLIWLSHFLAKRKNNRHPAVKPLVPVPAAGVGRASQIRIGWIGHATVLIQWGSVNILTDPVLGRTLGPFYPFGVKRTGDLPLKKEDLPHIHYVLLTHDHFDHLDKRSVQWLHRAYDPIFVAPLGIGKILNGWKIQNVCELDWWQYMEHEALRFSCLPANHWSGRPPNKYYQTLWCSWLLKQNNRTVYFAGDTAYATHFKDIAANLFSPDIAILPIGAYKPDWLHEIFHMNPAQAVQAFLDLGARYLIPMHWGTFDISEEPLQEPMVLFETEAKRKGIWEQVKAITIGDSWELDANQ